MKRWWIGCSGFYYKGWKDRFYPAGLPMRQWFEYYCRYFNTVELNVTFYRFPKPADLKGWYERSPADFRFTVKAPRLITHFKRFHNAKRETSDFYLSVREGLEDKLGTVLFQLHPGIAYSDENLARIVETMDSSFTNAIEFRHESWWRPQVYEDLKSEAISFCGISYPGLPEEVVKTAAAVYYRFHGVPRLYLSTYQSKKLKIIAQSLKHLRNVEDVYCYFNNDINVAAVRNAMTLRKIALGTSVPDSAPTP